MVKNYNPMSTNRRMDKQIVIQLPNGIVSSNGEECMTTCSNVDASHKCKDVRKKPVD